MHHEQRQKLEELALLCFGTHAGQVIIGRKNVYIFDHSNPGKTLLHVEHDQFAFEMALGALEGLADALPAPQAPATPAEVEPVVEAPPAPPEAVLEAP